MFPSQTPNIPLTCLRCGSQWLITKYNLKAKKTPYCKACVNTLRNQARAKHGLEKHPLYQTWDNMWRRVDQMYSNPKNLAYAGLDMDPEWRDVRNFITWALVAGWKPGLSIERKDIKRGYWPDNCTFIQVKHQARNRRNNSVTSTLAKHIQARVAAGENRYRVAKDEAKKTGIPLSTIVKVAYGYNWV